ncbi:MAG: hypothetical protein JJE52_00865 [Acidimicrobiia bacterium]|nr:hypothetical protein [Acidimicrobiia bacterium]
MRTRARTILVASVLVLGACSDSGGDDEGAEPAPSVTEPAGTTTTSTSGESTTTSTAAATGCPDSMPMTAELGDLEVAAEGFDGDGDGAADELSVVATADDEWQVRVAWAAGGSTGAPIVDAFMGARPLGGHDLDGDGIDEAFIAISGPASGMLVGLYRTDGCDLVPVLDAGTGQPFVFPVTASIGAFSGASCGSIGNIALINGELIDADAGEYEVAETPYVYDSTSGSLTAAPGDGGSAGFDEAGRLATLDCGSLDGAL